MALPKYKEMKLSAKDMKDRKKWENEITSVLYDKEELMKQFNKDSTCKNTDEISYKMYVYKKNNLNLFYKILQQHFIDTVAEINDTHDKMGKKIELDDKKIVSVDLETGDEVQDIDNLTESFSMNNNITQQMPYKKCWNMLKDFEYDKKELPEYDTYSIQKLINSDQILTFAFYTIMKNNGNDYDEAIDKIYNAYIKEDKILSKQLVIYEKYYTINEEINTNYTTNIELVLNEYDLNLGTNDRLTNHIYNKLTQLIDVNTDYLITSLEIVKDVVKSELYDFFKNNTIIDIVKMFEKTEITYNDIISYGNDYNESNEYIDKFINVTGLNDIAVETILFAMSDLEITNFLYIDNEEAITLTFFSCLCIIFRNAFNIL